MKKIILLILSFICIIPLFASSDISEKKGYREVTNYSTIYDEKESSIVRIYDNNTFKGTGIIIKSTNNKEKYKYYVLTNKKVIKDATNLKVGRGLIYTGNIYYTSENLEYVIIEYETILTQAVWNLTKIDDKYLNKGYFIGVLGYSMEYNLQLFQGVLSLSNDKYLYYDASTNYYNTGSALFNIYGNIIGLVIYNEEELSNNDEVILLNSSTDTRLHKALNINYIINDLNANLKDFL